MMKKAEQMSTTKTQKRLLYFFSGGIKQLFAFLEMHWRLTKQHSETEKKTTWEWFRSTFD